MFTVSCARWGLTFVGSNPNRFSERETATTFFMVAVLQVKPVHMHGSDAVFQFERETLLKGYLRRIFMFYKNQ